MSRRALAGSFFFLLLPGLAVAQDRSDPLQNRKTIQAIRMADGEAVTLDGRLDEPIWSRSVPILDFIQREPQNGEPATEATEVRIVYDREHLYLGVNCLDAEPDKLIAIQKQRDQNFDGDDRFMWSLDPYLDGRSGYSFTINPAGAVADALILPGQRDNSGTESLNFAWDGIWNARARRHDKGWTAEIEIPFRTLNFDPQARAWGANFQRTIRRKNEDTVWSGWGRNQGLNRMSTAGAIVGIRDVSQGFGLDIKPYALGRYAGLGENATARAAGHVGVDLAYSITPQLKGNFTVNTDFAETEVDDRQVNLTRFPLFFPERREFFLEGSSIFDFGREGGNAVRPFFSRRIGLNDAGAPQRIDYGAKVIGQVGRQDVGVIQVRTGTGGGMLGEDFTVARVKRRVLRESYVGVIYTRRHTSNSPIADRHATGVDFVLSTSTFLGNKNVELSGLYLPTTNLQKTGRSSARSLRFEIPNDRWYFLLGYREVQPNYAPPVGFIERTDFRRYRNAFGFNPRPKNSALIRRFSFNQSYEYFTNINGKLIERTWMLTLFQTDFQSGDSLRVTAVPKYEVLDKDFNVGGGIKLPKGAAFHYTRYSITGRTATQRMTALGGTVEWGSFYGGQRRQYVAEATIRPRPGIQSTLHAEWNRVQLPQGSFSAAVFRGIFNTQFSPWTSMMNNLQYDSVSRILGWQSRFRWILQPGNDVYFVYAHDWLDSLDGLVTLNRSATTKILYTHRF